VNSFQLSGRSSSAEDRRNRTTGSQAPQSIHSTNDIKHFDVRESRLLFWDGQSTGQASTQAVSSCQCRVCNYVCIYLELSNVPYGWLSERPGRNRSDLASCGFRPRAAKIDNESRSKSQSSFPAAGLGPASCPPQKAQPKECFHSSTAIIQSARRGGSLRDQEHHHGHRARQVGDRDHFDVSFSWRICSKHRQQEGSGLKIVRAVSD